jgi:hypothetical protein
MSNKFTINLVRSKNAKDCERALRQAYGLLLDTPCSNKEPAPTCKTLAGKQGRADGETSTDKDDAFTLYHQKDKPIE